MIKYVLPIFPPLVLMLFALSFNSVFTEQLDECSTLRCEDYANFGILFSQFCFIVAPPIMYFIGFRSFNGYHVWDDAPSKTTKPTADELRDRIKSLQDKLRKLDDKTKRD